MPARLPQYRAAALSAVLFVAAVAPWLATGAVATTAASSAAFGERVVYEQTGDVANVTVRASQPATVNIGSKYNGFWLQLNVGKGTTKLRINTYKAGESDRYSVSEMVWATDGSLQGRTLRTSSIDAPLDPAQYRMNVTINGHERAVGTLVVEPRASNGVTARIAPRAVDVSKLHTTADVRKVSVPPWKASVARDDWLLVHVDATGVRGALDKSRLDGDGGLMRVEFAQSNPPMNGEGNRFTGASVERLFVDGDGEGFYLAVDTGDHGIEPGDEYRVSFVVPKASPLAESRENVSTRIRVVERRIRVNRNGPGDEIVVEGATTVSGKTTLTPGTTVNLSARDTGIDPFLVPKTLTVRKDRTFSATFDFSDLERGRKFEFRLTDQRVTIPAVVGPVTTPTTATPTTTTATPAPTPTPTTTTPAPTTTTATPTTTTKTTAEGLTQMASGATEPEITQQAVETAADGGNDGTPVPGFGPVAGLLALAAGLVVALRRR